MEGHGDYHPSRERSRLLSSEFEPSSGGSASSVVSDLAARAATPTSLASLSSLAQYHGRYLPSALPGSNLAVMNSLLSGTEAARKAFIPDYWSAHTEGFPRYLMTSSLYSHYPPLYPAPADPLSLLGTGVACVGAPPGAPSSSATPSPSHTAAQYQRLQLLEIQKEALLAAAAANHHQALYGLRPPSLPFLERPPSTAPLSHTTAPLSLVKQEPNDPTASEKNNEKRHVLPRMEALSPTTMSSPLSLRPASAMASTSSRTEIYSHTKEGKSSSVFPKKTNDQINNSNLDQSESTSSKKQVLKIPSGTTPKPQTDSRRIKCSSPQIHNPIPTRPVPGANLTQASGSSRSSKSGKLSKKKTESEKSSLLTPTKPTSPAGPSFLSGSPIASLPTPVAPPIPLATVQHDGVLLSALASPSSAAASAAKAASIKASEHKKKVLYFGYNLNTDVSTHESDAEDSISVSDDKPFPEISEDHEPVTRERLTSTQTENQSEEEVDSTEKEELPQSNVVLVTDTRSEHERAIDETIQRVASGVVSEDESDSQDRSILNICSATTSTVASTMAVFTSSSASSGTRIVYAKTQPVPSVTSSGCNLASTNESSDVPASSYSYRCNLQPLTPSIAKRVHATTYVPEVGIFKGPSLKFATKTPVLSTYLTQSPSSTVSSVSTVCSIKSTQLSTSDSKLGVFSSTKLLARSSLSSPPGSSNTELSQSSMPIFSSDVVARTEYQGLHVSVTSSPASSCRPSPNSISPYFSHTPSASPGRVLTLNLTPDLISNVDSFDSASAVSATSAASLDIESESKTNDLNDHELVVDESTSLEEASCKEIKISVNQRSPKAVVVNIDRSPPTFNLESIFPHRQNDSRVELQVPKILKDIDIDKRTMRDVIDYSVAKAYERGNSTEDIQTKTVINKTSNLRNNRLTRNVPEKTNQQSNSSEIVSPSSKICIPSKTNPRTPTEPSQEKIDSLRKIPKKRPLVKEVGTLAKFPRTKNKAVKNDEGVSRCDSAPPLIKIPDISVVDKKPTVAPASVTLGTSNIPIGIAVAQIRPHHIQHYKDSPHGESTERENESNRHTRVTNSSTLSTAPTNTLTATSVISTATVQPPPALPTAANIVVAGHHAAPWLPQISFPLQHAMNSTGVGVTLDPNHYPISAPSGFKFAQNALTGQIFVVPVGDLVDPITGAWQGAPGSSAFTSPSPAGAVRQINITKRPSHSEDRSRHDKKVNLESSSSSSHNRQAEREVVIKREAPSTQSRGCSPIDFSNLSQTTLSPPPAKKLKLCSVSVQTCNISKISEQSPQLSHIDSEPDEKSDGTIPTSYPSTSLSTTQSVLNPLSVQCPDVDTIESISESTQPSSSSSGAKSMDRTSYNPFTDPQILQAADGLELLSTLAEKRPKCSSYDDPKRIFPSPSDSFKSDSASIVGLPMDDALSPQADGEPHSGQSTPRRDFRRELSPKWSLPKKEPSVLGDFKAPSALELDDSHEVRERLAEVQRKYKEKQKELAKLDSKKTEDCKNSKRGPGRPPKNKNSPNKKSEDESSSSSSSKQKHKEHHKKKRRADEIVDRVFRKLPPAIKSNKMSKSILYVKSKTGPFFKRKPASSKRNKDLYGNDEGTWPSFVEGKHRMKMDEGSKVKHRIKLEDGIKRIKSEKREDEGFGSWKSLPGSMFKREKVSRLAGCMERRGRPPKSKYTRDTHDTPEPLPPTIKSESSQSNGSSNLSFDLVSKFGLTCTTTALHSPSLPTTIISQTSAAAIESPCDVTLNPSASLAPQPSVQSFTPSVSPLSTCVNATGVPQNLLTISSTASATATTTNSVFSATFGSISSILDTSSTVFQPLMQTLASPKSPPKLSFSLVSSNTESSNHVQDREHSPLFGDDSRQRKLDDGTDSDTDTSESSPNKKRKPGRPRKLNTDKSSSATETIWAKKSNNIGLLSPEKEEESKSKQQLDSLTMKPLFVDPDWSRRRSERIFLNEPSPHAQQQVLSTVCATSPSRSSESMWKLSNFIPKKVKLKASDSSQDLTGKSSETTSCPSTPASSTGSPVKNPLQTSVSVPDISHTPSPCTSETHSISTETVKQEVESNNQKQNKKTQKHSRKDESNIPNSVNLSNKVKKKYSMKKSPKTCDSGTLKKNMEVIERPTTPVVVSNLSTEPRDCKLQIKDLREGLRVLYFDKEAGLLYEGTVKLMVENEVYGILTAGQRGNRPHVLSAEQITKDAVLDVKTNSNRFLPIGTRVCAFWSNQFSSLYPGTVATPSSPDPEDTDEDVVNVEFDDGDSGRIKLDHIRMLPSDFPIINIDSDPLENPKRRRSEICTSRKSETGSKSSKTKTRDSSASKVEDDIKKQKETVNESSESDSQLDWEWSDGSLETNSDKSVGASNSQLDQSRKKGGKKRKEGETVL